MSEPALQNRRVLVVEDEYFLAVELKTELERAGAQVLVKDNVLYCVRRRAQWLYST